MRTSRMLCLLTLVGVFGAGSASAQVFTTRSSWLAALTGSPTTVNFSGVAPLSNCLGNCAVGPFTLSGATFNSSEIPFIVDANNDGDGIYDWGTGPIFSPQTVDITDVNQMFVTLPGFFFAAGFDYGQNLGGNGTDGAVDLSNGNSYVLPSSNNWPTLGFFGVVSNTAFNGFTIDIRDQSYAPIFDNVSWGNAQASSVVPEPGTLGLLATGLAGMVTATGRRRRRPSGGL